MIESCIEIFVTPLRLAVSCLAAAIRGHSCIVVLAVYSDPGLAVIADLLGHGYDRAAQVAEVSII